jgi:VWFA-related protein
MHARTVPYAPASLMTLHTDVDVVEVPVVVRDSQHRAVPGLTREDFEILDAGKKQNITTFSVQHFTPAAVPGGAKPSSAAAPARGAAPAAATAPRFVAICFDDLNIDSAGLKPAKDAAERFVKTDLAPGDKVAIISTAQSQNTDFISDVPKLLDEISKVVAHQRFSDDSSQCPRIRPYEAYLISNSLDQQTLQAKVNEGLSCPVRVPRQAVIARARGIWDTTLSNSRNTLRLVDELVGAMAKMPGQRMILLTSSGFLTGNLEEEEDRLMTKALHSEVVINTLDAKGLSVNMPDVATDAAAPPPSGRTSQRTRNVNTQNETRQAEAKDDGMAVLSAGTGGTFFHNSNDLAKGFRELGMVPETLYILGFAPTDVVADGSFHSLKVRLASGKHYSLQARLGYNAPMSKAAQAAAPSKLDTAVTGSESIADLPAAVSWEQRGGAHAVTMIARVDIEHLHFDTSQKRHAQRLAFVAFLADKNGAYISGKRCDLELNFTEPTFAQLSKSGLSFVMTLDAPPGTYTVRAAVQDSLDGKLVATGGTAEVK